MSKFNSKKNDKEQETLTRIAIVSTDRCKPKKCRQECKKSCPVVRMGKLCIEANPDSKIAYISEELCIGCGICVKVIDTQPSKFIFKKINKQKKCLEMSIRSHFNYQFAK